LRRSLETIMANTWHLQQASRWTVDRVRAALRALARAVAADHAQALDATTKAASPRKSQAEVRAMYTTPLDRNR
jgi:hypothetical protein